jgi:hypothetical protein
MTSRFIIVFGFLFLIGAPFADSAPLECERTSDTWITDKIECKFSQMPVLYQKSWWIPENYKGKKITKDTACGPTAVASIYRVIDANSDFYQPKPGTFFSSVAKKDVYSELIPELFIKTKTSDRYGTTPNNIYDLALSSSYFNFNGHYFSHFLTSEIVSEGAKSYYQSVATKNSLMAVLLGYYQPKCANVLLTKKCILVVPDSLHYEALYGVSGNLFKPAKSLGMVFNSELILSDGNQNLERTSLKEVTSGCKSYSTYEYCSEIKWFRCVWKKMQICDLEYTLPFLLSRSQRFTSDNDGSLWTIVHGKVGLESN